MVYQKEDFEAFPRLFRANFFNSILGYKPANLIGSVDKNGVENLAIFNSAVHLGASPPLIGLVSRPDSVPRHSLDNIRKTSYYTLNHVNAAICKQAHQSSANYAQVDSEFIKVGLSPEYIEKFPAPFVKESEVRLGMQLREILPIKMNGTYFIIGEIILVDVSETMVSEDGSLDYNALSTIAVTGLDTYHKAEQLQKLNYARP